MKYLLVLSFVIFGSTLLPTAVSAQDYDIKEEFCGVHIDSSFCKCAFHGESCDATGLDQTGAEDYLYGEFDFWTTEQEVKRCDALGKDYEGECVDRDVDPEELAAILAGDLMCQVSDPTFWDNFWDGKDEGVDHEANDNAFANAHGYDTLDQGIAAYESLLHKAAFRERIESQVASACPNAAINFEEFWASTGIELDEEEYEDEDEYDEDDDEEDEDEEDDEDDEEETFECSADDHQQFDRKTKKCGCVKLWKLDKEKDCIFTGDDGAKLEFESSIELTDLMDGMDPNERAVFTGKNTKGESVEVGIVRLPNGEYVFTPDGQHFYDNPKDAIKPGFFRSVGTFISDKWGGIRQAFGVGRYTARDTKDNPEKQEEGQRRYDASVGAFRDLTANPKPAVTTAESNKIWAERIGKMIEGKGQEFVEAELTRKMAEQGINTKIIDAKTIGQFARGEYGDITDAKMQKITIFLQTLPAQSVVVLAEELRDADFANGASLYMDQREQGKSIEEVSNALKEGDLVELDYIASKGIAYEQTRFALLGAYEDAYQRYQLRKELEK